MDETKIMADIVDALKANKVNLDSGEVINAIVELTRVAARNPKKPTFNLETP